MYVNDGTTLFLGHFGMGRFCTWAVFVWAVFACGPFWDGPFSFGMTWYLGRLHLKAYVKNYYEFLPGSNFVNSSNP